MSLRQSRFKRFFRVVRFALNLLSIARNRGRFTIVQLETENRCTRTCWFCKFGQKRSDPEDLQLPQDVFDRVLSELSELNFKGRVSIYGINEPLMDDRILARLAQVRKACPRAFVSIDTNGDLLDLPMLDKLIEAGADTIFANAYDTTALKRLKGFPYRSAFHVEDFRVSAPRVENRGGNIRLKKPVFDAKAWEEKSCLRPSNTLQIRANGDVVLCCGDMYGDVVFGNVAKQSLVSIWNSTEMRRTRRQLQKGRRKGLPLCGDCSHDGTASLIVPFAAKKLRLKKLTEFSGAWKPSRPSAVVTKDASCP